MARPDDETGKNRSGSQDRQAAADRQCLVTAGMLFSLSATSLARHEVMVAVRPPAGIVNADGFSRPGFPEQQIAIF
jgi:hypothetical protein